MSRQNSFLGRLPPRARQILTLGGAAAAVLGVVYLGVSSQEQVHRQSSDNVIKNVLTDKNTREMTIDSMAAEMRRLVKENAGLRREIEVLKDEVDRKDYNAGIKIDPQVLRSQLNALTQEITRQKEQISATI
jgi:conjugal transfer pilus assembly protein TraB